jgi:tRNA(adenine34) deaminase
VTSPDFDDQKLMAMALDEARAAVAHGDVPVGAVLVSAKGAVLARSRNEREQLASPVAHAEMQALVLGARAAGHWNLTGSRLYVTLEPCAMCAGALVLARVAELIYAAEDPKGGVLSLGISILENPSLNHRVKARRGPLAEESAALLREFFRERRREKGSSGRKEP